MKGYVILLILLILLYLLGFKKIAIFLSLLLLFCKKKERIIKGGKDIKYFLLDDDKNYKEWFHKKLRKHLIKKGWKEKKFGDNFNKLDLVSIKPYNYKLLNDVIPKIQLYSKREDIMFKNKVYKIFKKYMMPQYEINILKDNPNDYKFINGKTWMLKPVASSKGKGIKLIRNHEDFNKAFLEEKESKKFINKVTKEDIWVLSEYMENGLLWDNKKFHLRVYIYVIIKNNTYSWNYLNYGKIFVSKKDFDIKSNDIEVHNIHANNATFYSFPEDFNKKFNNITNKVIRTIKNIKNIVSNNTKNKCFDSDICFQLYGIDLAIDKDNNIKIFEINSHPGSSTKNDVATDKIIEVVDSIL